MELYQLKKIVPNSQNWIEAKPLTRGNSPDKKIRITDSDQRKYLLRFSKDYEYESKKQIFDRMRLAFATGIPMSEPCSFGKTADGEVYSLFSWLEGIDADTNIGDLTPKQQYDFGIEIGRIQKKIHSVTAQGDDNYDWFEKFSKEKQEVLDWFEGCGAKIDCADEIVAYVRENADLMKNRPITLAHGDYQISNFVIMPDGHAGIIDFDYIRYSDPMQETQALTIYTRSKCAPVAAGQIDGYFDGAPTDEFFALMKFYTAYNLLSGLKWWAMTHGEGGIAHFSKIISLCCADYDVFTLDIPKWYTDSKNI